MSNNKKPEQSAVDWLVEQFDLTSQAPIIKNIVDQAKQIDKEQKIDFARHCLNKAKDLDILTSFINVEQYYNETYATTKSS